MEKKKATIWPFILTAVLSLLVGAVISFGLMAAGVIHYHSDIYWEDNGGYYYAHYYTYDEIGDKDTVYGYYITDNNNDACIISFKEEPTEEYGIISTTGTLVNTTNTHFSTISINLSVLDENNNKIADIYAASDGLNANGTWYFVAEGINYTDHDAAKIVLDDIDIGL